MAVDKLQAMLDGKPTKEGRRQTAQEMLDVLNQWEAVQAGLSARDKAAARSPTPPKTPNA
jgi:hypothetical protein